MKTSSTTKKVNIIIDGFINNLNCSGISFIALAEQCKVVESIVLRYGTNKKGIEKLSNAINQLNDYEVA